jgi:hypothetical protein
MNQLLELDARADADGTPNTTCNHPSISHPVRREVPS